MDRILLSSPAMHAEELQFIQEAFDRNWVAPLGFNCDGFESETVSYLRSKGYVNGNMHALALCSGTAALHLAVKLAGVKPGDTVLCSDMTFAATVNPVSYEGGVQVFVDSEYETWNMDPEALRLAFERHPEARVVILAHLYGTPARTAEIKRICEEHNALLIEDAAEAIGSVDGEIPCGAFGDLSVLSFNGNKLITTSGGGMLLTRSADQRNKALFWATQSRENTPWYQHNEIGYNYRLSNICAGIGRGQLIHIEEHRRRKEEIYELYRESLKDLPVRMNPYSAGSRPNFWLSCMTIENGKSPIELLQRLAEGGADGRPIWKPMHMQPVFAGREFLSCRTEPADEDIFARGLCLPSDIKMTAEQQMRVIGIIRDFF